MTTLFIADLHLEESRPDIAALFTRFLREEAVQAKSLYILGDLFEAWIGDDDNSPFNLSIIQALRQLVNQGTAVYFMRGNRDFLIGRTFLKQTGCRLLPDEHLIYLNNQPILLMHGDTLCTQDEKYLKFRKHSRRFLMQKLFLMKSLAKRKALAQQARKISYDHTQGAAPDILDVTQHAVEHLLRKHRVCHLIHGHTHRPAVHEFLLDDVLATRTVLAPWHENGNALVCHADGRQESIVII